VRRAPEFRKLEQKVRDLSASNDELSSANDLLRSENREVGKQARENQKFIKVQTREIKTLNEKLSASTKKANTVQKRKIAQQLSFTESASKKQKQLEKTTESHKTVVADLQRRLDDSKHKTHAAREEARKLMTEQNPTVAALEKRERAVQRNEAKLASADQSEQIKLLEIKLAHPEEACGKRECQQEPESSKQHDTGPPGSGCRAPETIECCQTNTCHSGLHTLRQGVEVVKRKQPSDPADSIN